MSAGLTAAAVAGLAGSAIAAGGAVAGGMMSAKGAKGAAAAQQQGVDEATNLQREMWQTQQAQQKPWLEAGGTGLNALMYRLGLGGAESGVLGPTQVKMGGTYKGFEIPSNVAYEAFKKQADITDAEHRARYGMSIFDPRSGLMTGQTPVDHPAIWAKAAAVETPALLRQQRLAERAATKGKTYGQLLRPFGMQDFQEDPGYKFRLREGLKALDRTASARGGLLSGGALKAAEGYGQEMGSQEYGNAFNRFQIGQGNVYNRLAALSGVGQQAAQQLGQAGQQYGQTAGNLAMAGGENRANALLSGAQARGSMYQGVGQALGGAVQQLYPQQQSPAPYGVYRGF